jgi:hypothetical protein
MSVECNREALCEFTVEAMHLPACIDGRNCGDDLPVGFHFTELVERVSKKVIEANGNWTYVSADLKSSPISWHVSRIEAYRRRLEILSSGMTARLTFDEDISHHPLGVALSESGRHFIIRGPKSARFL